MNLHPEHDALIAEAEEFAQNNGSKDVRVFARNTAKYLRALAIGAAPAGELPPLPERAARASWWNQNAFNATSLNVLRKYATPGIKDTLDLFTAEQMHEYARATFAAPSGEPAPIDMVLHCPKCGMQHVDAPEQKWAGCDKGLQTSWANPPHRSHLCHGCYHIWRPADVPTNGVQAVQTKGKADSPIASPSGEPAPVKTWQHDETGRTCRLERSPGPRWAEMPNSSPTPAREPVTCAWCAANLEHEGHKPGCRELGPAPAGEPHHHVQRLRSLVQMLRSEGRLIDDEGDQTDWIEEAADWIEHAALAAPAGEGRTITKLYEHQLADNERLRAAYARLHDALNKIAERTSSDDPCRHLVQIARNALTPER